MKSFDFENLFIFDLANNHQGDVRHASSIIKSVGEIADTNKVRAALKFQFRELETFIHPDYADNTELSHINRFLSTKLSGQEYEKLVSDVRTSGMITMATSFDEPSVDLIEKLGIEVIKIASCSSFDWPLLEKAVSVDKPLVISTAGLPMSKIDRLVYFFKSKGKDFALMHCVALYPTDNDKLNLNQIALLKERFPGVPVGFSTHEHPENYNAVRVAYAKGARLFERHVGLETEKHKLNAYSSTPDFLDGWIKAYKETVDACGGEERSPAYPEERESLKSLMRGVYAKKKINEGDCIGREDVFFAMPLLEGQLSSGEWKKCLKADRKYSPNGPIGNESADLSSSDEEYIAQIILQVKGMLNNGKITVGEKPSIEISHHYGLERFREFGAVIIDCINRGYCKKLMVQLPRQKHPYHYHRKKEESFQLLDGDFEIEIEGRRYQMNPGDVIHVEPGKWHKFHTLDGAIVEEVSTTHYNDDSYYEDEKIARLSREKRKTKITNWDLL